MSLCGGRCGAAEASCFGIQVFRGRWFMLFACFLIMSASGATYIFGIYSKDIKSSLGYDQQTLNTISFFKDLGSNISIIAGLINEIAPPWLMLLTAAAMNVFGYLMVYLAITGHLARPAVWQICFYICIGANSQTFSNTATLVTCVKNFPNSRGIVLGLLKGFLGLSGAIFTQLYLALYGNESKSLVLLTAWLPAAISIVFIPTIRIMEVVKKTTRENIKAFYCFLYISLALVGYFMMIIIIQKRITFSHPEYSASGAIVILLLFLPLVVVIKEELQIWNQKKESLKNLSAVSIIAEKPMVIKLPETEPMPLATESTLSTKESSAISRFARAFKGPDRGEDYSILQGLTSCDMTLIVLAVVCGVGGNLTAINNMGQIGESLGYSAQGISTFVSLISIWNCLGRLASGFVSEILLVKHKFPRPLLLTIVLLISCVGHLLIALGIPGSLYFSSVIIGFCLGAQAPLFLAMISEIFGLKYYSTLYNFGVIASPLGTYILNVKVTGHLYDREAAKQNNGVKASTCVGAHCFKLAFLIITAVTFVSAVVSFILVLRTWNFYKGDVYAKFKEAAVAEGDKEVAMEGSTNVMEDRDEDSPHTEKRIGEGEGR